MEEALNLTSDRLLNDDDDDDDSDFRILSWRRNMTGCRSVLSKTFIYGHLF